MGRPIKETNFGTGTSGIGGAGVASITVGGTNNAYVAIPGVTIAAPQLAGGVQAALGTAHMGVDGINNFTSGSGYTPAEVLTLTGGTGTQGTITVDTTAIATLVVNAPGTGYTTGNVVTISGGTGTLGTATVVVDNGSGGVASFSTFTPGSYTVNPTTLIGAATTGAGNSDLTVNITMGIGTASVTTAGDYTVLPVDTTIVGVNTGGALLNLTYKVVSIPVTTAGSGYSSAPVVTVAAGNATGTAVLGAALGSSIAASAWTVAGGASRTGVDIVKQVGARRYKMTSLDGTGVCRLVARVPTAVGEASMSATDSSGKTYYVTKLTTHKALLTQYGAAGHEFTSGTEVHWTLGTAVLNYSVRIDNV